MSIDPSKLAGWSVISMYVDHTRIAIEQLHCWQRELDDEGGDCVAHVETRLPGLEDCTESFCCQVEVYAQSSSHTRNEGRGKIIILVGHREHCLMFRLHPQAVRYKAPTYYLQWGS